MLAVPAAYTSQTCPACSHVSADNRQPSQGGLRAWQPPHSWGWMSSSSWVSLRVHLGFFGLVQVRPHIEQLFEAFHLPCPQARELLV
jgi:hypothetical protein